MSQSQVVLGISPANMRLAFEYLELGVGTHPIEHSEYDQVQVTRLRDFESLVEPRAGVEYGAIVRVSLYKGSYRIRFIDFSVLCTGGGGDAAIRLIEDV